MSEPVYTEIRHMCMSISGASLARARRLYHHYGQIDHAGQYSNLLADLGRIIESFERAVEHPEGRSANDAHPDTVRLEWLQSECFDIGIDDGYFYVVRESDGENFRGFYLRNAIDAAMASGTGEAG